MQAAEIDVRLARRPIERYEWVLGLALLVLSLSILIGERKRARQRNLLPAPVKIATAAAALILFFTQWSFANAPGLDLYREGKFEDAYARFQQTLKEHPQSRAEDKLQFDSGAAAYKLKDYGKALEAFSQALLSPDQGLQAKSHYNLGNTLYQRGETLPSDDKKLSDWTNALQHYEQTLKLESENREAKENYEYVKKKIEELRQHRSEQQSATPPPPPPLEPSTAAKKAKEEADRAVRQRAYRKALTIMDRQLAVDQTVNYYADYIRRLEQINDIKKTDNP